MSALNLLLTAASKQSIEQALLLVFLTRHQPMSLCEQEDTVTPLQVCMSCRRRRRRCVPSSRAR
jgi:hypothetical protein